MEKARKVLGPRQAQP